MTVGHDLIQHEPGMELRSKPAFLAWPGLAWPGLAWPGLAAVLPGSQAAKAAKAAKAARQPTRPPARPPAGRAKAARPAGSARRTPCRQRSAGSLTSGSTCAEAGGRSALARSQRRDRGTVASQNSNSQNSKVPEPMLMFTSKCPFGKFKISQGLG